MGAFEFRLCNVDRMPNGEATQECLDSLLLTDESGKTLMMNTNQQDNARGPVHYRLRIPAGFTCNHCVLQVDIRFFISFLNLNFLIVFSNF